MKTARKAFVRSLAGLGLSAVLLAAPPWGTAPHPLDGLLPQIGQANAAPPWYDTNWQYRRAVAVDNTANTQDLTNFQVNVALGAGDFNFAVAGAEGQDIRLTDADGTTVVPYWIESYSAAAKTASIWIKVPSLPARSARTVYLYYGNTAATAASNGSQTFDLYDGFDASFGYRALANAPAPLTTPTYDGSGEAVHPDVVYFPNGWHGRKYWMVVTPYPHGNDQYENPSILASDDGLSWAAPPSATNPLVPTPPCDHNNDADMIYNAATDELWIYYLDSRRASRCDTFFKFNRPDYYDHNYLKVIKSKDGIHWTTPATVIDWPLARDPLFLSPSIVLVGQTYFLWMTDSSSVWLAKSNDGLTFGPLQKVNLADTAWHIDVEYIPDKSEYWMVLDYARAFGYLRFARSADGVNWTTFNNALLFNSGTGWDGDLYRATFLYDSATDTLRLWYSAYDIKRAWRVGYTSAQYGNILTQLSSTGGWRFKQGAGANTWTSSTARVKRGTSSGELMQTTTTPYIQLAKQLPLANNFYQEWDMYDDMDTAAFKVLRAVNRADNRVGVGVWTGESATNYVFHDKDYDYTTTSVARTLGWHKFGLLIKSDGSVTYFVDGQNVGINTGQFANASQAQVEGSADGPTTYNVDDLRVRQWTSAAPSVTVGAEEQKPANDTAGLPQRDDSRKAKRGRS